MYISWDDDSQHYLIFRYGCSTPVAKFGELWQAERWISYHT